MKLRADETPIFLANSSDIVDLFVAHGADVNAKAYFYDCFTPLQKVIRDNGENVIEVVIALIRHGANVNEKNGYYFS